MKNVMTRKELVVLFDIKNGNPNGDPDNDNSPRQDVFSKKGLVTDVCLKKKVRKYVEIAKEEEREKGFDIYIKEGDTLEKKNREAIGEVKNKKTAEEVKKDAIRILCEKFYDNRTFGALLIHKADKKDKKDKGQSGNEVSEKNKEKDKNLGGLTGPVQFTYAESINEIKISTDSITRNCVTNEEDKEDERTMGRKSKVSYGLYKFYIYITPYFARKTGFNEQDYELLKEALVNMFMFDKSASRQEMSVKGLWEFEHPNELGVAPDWKVTSSVKVIPKNKEPLCFDDFDVKVENVPEKVKVTQIV